MRPAHFNSAVCASLLALPLVLAATGCHGHRVDPYKDTNSELDDGRILPAALLEFSDQAPKVISQNLANAPVIKEIPGDVKVILGTIRNLTTSTNTSEFEIVTHRIQNALINNQSSGKLAFVMDRARMKETANREEVVNANGTPANPPAYDAATTFVLNLDVNEVSRGGTHLYYMQVTLTHYGSNRVVLSDDYQIKHETK